MLWTTYCAGSWFTLLLCCAVQELTQDTFKAPKGVRVRWQPHSHLTVSRHPCTGGMGLLSQPHSY